MYVRTLKMSLFRIISLFSLLLSLLSLLQTEVAQKARKSTFGGVFDRKRVKSQGALRCYL